MLIWENDKEHVYSSTVIVITHWSLQTLFTVPRFTIGSEHLCRIIGYSSVERLLFVSTRTSDLNKTIISAEEAKPGTKLKGTVKVIRPNGMIVELGEELTGFLSTMHALDKPDKQWQKRFHISKSSRRENIEITLNF
jgi:ribosomal protein S1